MFRHSHCIASLYCTVCLLVGLASTSADAASLRNPLGDWLTESGHGVIAIESCGDALCGRIVGIDRDPGTPMPTDVQGRSQCGLTIITNERPTEKGIWLGKVIDPRSGKAYHAELWVDDNDTLHLRGYVGIPLLGETQLWHRFTGHLTANCDMR